MSDTPRTDEAVNDTALEDKNHPHTDWVTASFARQLERELNKARDALKEHCFYATKKAGFSREGYTLETNSDTAFRDIEYRGCQLFDTSEEAVNHYLKAP